MRPRIGLLALLALLALSVACVPALAAASATPIAVDAPPDAIAAARRSGVDLKALITASARTALARLPRSGRIRFAVSTNAAATIPELGVGGFTDTYGDVQLAIDTTRVALGRNLRTWIPAVVAHELHHSSRTRAGPGYGRTLGAALVSEGLADRFVYEVFPQTPSQPWDHALTKKQARAYWQKARPLLDRGSYDHRAWFFGGTTTARWVGYTLGWEIAGRYVAAHDVRPSEAVDADHADVLRSFRGP